MEATPGYFYGGETLARAIDASVPGVRIAIVFRDPVSRLVSPVGNFTPPSKSADKVKFGSCDSKCGFFGSSNFTDALLPLSW